ncbi:cation channel sperm-associated protein 3 [Exaiptasia diaphana]|uniref:Ion transport domain-containing protein n=1 Tax=Exaiptasia diaphana TaxID=2652724 RepID=A0A913YK45_EXADI|nr:cation channel sperm-associated protein 3 [Exaiptasia diaphana]KXJ20362.1 Cation channel sperm-associated protein 3 [Exaiptasia diaphana]
MLPVAGHNVMDVLRSQYKKRRRYDEKFHKFIQKITMSNYFNGFIMGIIIINALCIGLETVDKFKTTEANTFKILDEFFLSIYTMEFLMKIYAEPSTYWKSSYNIFDFTILLTSYIQVIMDELNVGDNLLTPLRLLRVARTLRTISFIEGLQVLVTALIDTIRHSVLNVVILLTMLMGFFAVVGYYIFGYEEETGDKEHWGNLSTAMLTLFTFVTVDGWTDIQKGLEKRPYSQWFTITFIFVGHFIFTNLFIGIIIMNIHEATEKFIEQQRQEKEAILQMKKDYLFKRQHEDVKKMIEKQKSSQFANFEEMTQSFKETLRNDDYVIMTDPCTNPTWMETYLTTTDHLDLYMFRCQQLHFKIASVLADMYERKVSQPEGSLLSRLKQLATQGPSTSAQ